MRCLPTALPAITGETRRRFPATDVAYARGCVDVATITMLSGSGRMADLHAAELPQKDNLCGCFWVTLALRAAGIEQALGEPVDQDLVGREAGSILPDGGDPAEGLPEGAQTRGDYRLELPTSSDWAITGTSVEGLTRAVRRLSGGALEPLPVAGTWSAQMVLRALEALAEAAPDATVIANVRTGPLWGSHPPLPVVFAALAGREHAEPPPSDWDVGHFVELAGVIHGPGGSLVVVRDTYPVLGFGGYHLQPPHRLALALLRGDGREGGLLVVAAPAAAEKAGRALTELGLEIRLWDNGTPLATSDA